MVGTNRTIGQENGTILGMKITEGGKNYQFKKFRQILKTYKNNIKKTRIASQGAAAGAPDPTCLESTS